MDRKSLIDSQPILASVPEPLWKFAERRKIEAGETLFRIDDPVQCMLIVISGEVRLIRRDRNGREIILQRVRKGFVAEASLDVKTYLCDVVAAEQGEVLSFPVREFRASLCDDSKFQSYWMKHLEQEVRRLRAQCERLSLHSAADRIFHYIESEGVDGVVMLDQTRKTWAAELGLTHEALYRALNKLKAEGLLDINDKQIKAISLRNV